MQTTNMPFKLINLGNGLPICPKCHKLIAEKKLRRHKSRCGKKPKVKKVITQDNVAPAGL